MCFCLFLSNMDLSHLLVGLIEHNYVHNPLWQHMVLIYNYKCTFSEKSNQGCIQIERMSEWQAERQYKQQ